MNARLLSYLDNDELCGRLRERADELDEFKTVVLMKEEREALTALMRLAADRLSEDYDL